MQVCDLAVLTAIAAQGSLSGAARYLGISPMNVSRRLAALEREVGVRLVQRSTRSVSFTQEGEALLPYAETMLITEEAARKALTKGACTASGLLRVTSPTVFGQTVILPMIPALLRKHPGLEIDLTLGDSIVDIVGLGLDVAIRIATLQDSALIARGLAPNPRVLCASPGYLAEHGVPRTVEDLSKHRRIALHAMPYWPFLRQQERISVKAEGGFSANSVEAVRTACKHGVGLALLTYWDIRAELADGSLVAIELIDVSQEQLSVAAVLPSRRHVPFRVRAFLEELESVMRSIE
ncbi:LysR family transcriptional regulator [Pseudomonas taiwanensis]|uniref:LysR family transcriptional regulator n=1 Tax=Pseudomonas taiwanensis TaxID=470150 RepID=A0ABR6VD07_9PSED|nr:LysR family transcriptional regulator [Pseudomonas taiwanensis]MBC3478028.1 LysR family transcriptional regulator [Pseudomonas taiwanensis]